MNQIIANIISHNKINKNVHMILSSLLQPLFLLYDICPTDSSSAVSPL